MIRHVLRLRWRSRARVPHTPLRTQAALAFRAIAVALIVLAVAAANAHAQALTSLSSVRVRYNTQKNTVQPTGALKAQLDEVERQIAEASRRGANGEVRRLYAKGRTLLSGREWTPAADFANSLVIRTDQVVADSGKPYAVRLEQIYAPAIDLNAALTAHALLRKPPVAAAAGSDRDPEPGALVKDLGTVTGIARDLRESPGMLELDVRGVPDGQYQLAVDVANGTPLGTATLLVNLRKGLDATVAQLETAARTAAEPLRSEILFPVDRMRNVNRGKLELRTFDPNADFTEALAAAEAARSKRDPFAARKGDFTRHYLLDGASEIMPYRMYVPTTYDGSRAYPLIVALHGLGGTEDSFFEGYDKTFPPLAERHGYIVAAPFGYRVDGFYGSRIGGNDPEAARTSQLSEQDVMRVLELVRRQYRIDENRIYLAGHSMGGIGVWAIAPKYPDIWAAIAPFAGSGQPASLERIKQVPEFVVHGDADKTVNVQGSRAMVAKAKELGIDVTYVEVPGGSHGGVVAPNLPGMFEFFNAHKKTAKSTSQ